jgi:hypothetical protein
MCGCKVNDGEKVTSGVVKKIRSINIGLTCSAPLKHNRNTFIDFILCIYK